METGQQFFLLTFQGLIVLFWLFPVYVDMLHLYVPLYPSFVLCSDDAVLQHLVRVRKRSCFSLLGFVTTNPAGIIQTSHQKYLVLSPLRCLENILTKISKFGATILYPRPTNDTREATIFFGGSAVLPVLPVLPVHTCTRVNARNDQVQRWRP